MTKYKSQQLLESKKKAKLERLIRMKKPIIALYKNGATLNEIAHLFKCSTMDLFYLIKSENKGGIIQKCK